MIGTQTFPLDREFAQDVEGTIRKIQTIGMDAIEPLVVLMEKQGRMPNRFWTFEMVTRVFPLMKELGLSLPSVHIGAGFMGQVQPLEEIVAGMRRLHEMTGVSNFVFSGMYSDAQGAEKWGKLLHDIAEATRVDGFNTIYHNHPDEFAEIEVEGRTMTALDYFYEIAGPDVFLELDIGWAGFAGDEVAIVNQYRNRMMELHCKDFYPGKTEGYTRDTVPVSSFSPIGEGMIRTEEVIKIVQECPNFNGVIILDQDHSAGDIMDDLAIGIKNVKRMLEA